MNPSRTSARVHAFLTACAALLAAAIAALAVRAPEVWPLLPSAPMQLAATVLGATSQERIADAEFFGAWLFAFVLALAFAYLALALVRRVSRGSTD